MNTHTQSQRRTWWLLFGVALLAGVTSGCTKNPDEGGGGGGDTQGGPRSAANPVSLTSNDYLDYIGAALNYEWRNDNTLRTSLNNQVGSMPSDPASPMSSAGSRLFMNLSFRVCDQVAVREFGQPENIRKVFRFIITNRGPIVGTTNTQQPQGAVIAFLRLLTDRLWGRPANAEEETILLGIWNSLAPQETNNGTGTRQVATRLCAVAATSTQALMAR